MQHQRPHRLRLLYKSMVNVYLFVFSFFFPTFRLSPRERGAARDDESRRFVTTKIIIINNNNNNNRDTADAGRPICRFDSQVFTIFFQLELNFSVFFLCLRVNNVAGSVVARVFLFFIQTNYVRHLTISRLWTSTELWNLKFETTLFNNTNNLSFKQLTLIFIYSARLD